MRFALLGSGSAGNAMLLMSGKTRILVDCGLSYRQLQLRAAALGESVQGLSGVFVTHEHRDHVNGLGVLSRKLRVPVYMTPATAECLSPALGRIDRLEVFDAGDTISIGDLTVQSFSVTHDAADPVSFVVQNGQCRIGLATDLGKVTALVRQRLAECTALVLESNYCPQLLKTSSYPAAIRQRINSAYGHLSNADMSSLLTHVLHDALRLVVIVHVSQENNTVDRARMLAAQVLGNHGAELVVAEQDTPTPLFDLDALMTAAPVAP